MTTSEGRKPLWLDRKVAVWLHEVADEYYGGDVEKAMNEALTTMMLKMKNPTDPWAGITWQAAARRRRDR